MLARTEGIVLRTQKYGEADLIVTYLTPNKGIIRAFAKSPRKMNSRFGSSLEPLTHAQLSLWGKEQAMPKITQSDVISSYHQLRENYDAYIGMSKLTEIIMSILPESVPHKGVFELLRDILEIASSSVDEKKDALFLIAQVRLLTLTGYAPGLRDCGKCGRKSNTFYPESGTLLCGRCSSSQHTSSGDAPIRVDDMTLRFCAHSTVWPLHITCRLKPHREMLSEFSRIIDKHLHHLLNKKLLSSEFTV